jgi:uncharacterized protein
MPDGRLLGSIASLVLVVGVVLMLAWIFQRRLIYFPMQQAVPPVQSALPGAEEVALQTQDGLRLGGWFLPADQADGRAVLVFNGNAGDRSHRAPLAAALARRGWSVLLFDYRGYGRNPGTPSEAGLAADARAARAYVASRADVDPSRIAYFGESLGAAVAVTLATEAPPAALVLRSPFTSLVDMGRLHYPWLPVGRLLLDRFSSIDRIARIDSPMLVIAGDRDRIVPLAQSQRLYEAAREPKRLVVIEGADHNDLELLAGPRLLEEVSLFLAAPRAG